MNATSPWRPLRTPLFRNLLPANVVSDMGAIMQTVGAAWLMVSLHAGPLYVALIQTASALPFFVFALPAGAIGDIADRRRLILVTEIWMLVTAVTIAAVTIAGAMTPWLLLALTFALSAGDAIETPTWRAGWSDRRGAALRPLRTVVARPDAPIGRDDVLASALLALLPSVAHSVSGGPTGYGVLLGCFGAGAVLGAITLPQARARFSTETVASAGVVILGASTITTSALHGMLLLAAVVFAAGAAWIVFISLMNALMQLLAPDWVRARVLAVFMLVFQGSLAAGSAVWGSVADREGLHIALLAAGVGVLLSALLGRVASLPDTTADTTPWNHWRMPVIVGHPGLEPDAGPVLVTSEYTVAPESVSAFLEGMVAHARARGRDGAYRWGIFRDVEKPGSSESRQTMTHA